MQPVLHVCTACRAGRSLREGETTPGSELHAALVQARNVSRETIHEYTLTAAGLPEIRPVACLAACDLGCTATIAAPGKWRILLGRLDASLATDLIGYARLYAASPNGTVLPSRRAPSLRHSILGRIPA